MVPVALTYTGGETLLSDVVVCNRDLPAAYGLIKGAGPYPEERASALDKLNYRRGRWN